MFIHLFRRFRDLCGHGAQLDLATFERVLNATLGPRAARELAPRLFAAADTSKTGTLQVPHCCDGNLVGMTGTSLVR